MAGRALDERLMGFVSFLLRAVFCVALFLPSVSLAMEAGAFPFEEFGVTLPRQRSLEEIAELPCREDSCPVCGFGVEIPLVDALVREPKGGKWVMDAARRDSDFCPYPSPGKVFWQADVVICPNCGYAAEAGKFPEAVSPKAVEWVLANLQPSLRAAQSELLGWRRGEMTDKEVAVYFNRQSEIPDVLRLEHWLTCLDGMHAPTLERARGSWRSAWAFRRRLAAEPESELFLRYAAELRNEVVLSGQSPVVGLRGEVEALRSLIRRKGRKKNELPGAVDMTGRLLLAGVWDRYGFLDESEELLEELYNECRERFLKPEQDPLWVETSARASRTHRLNELELLRADAEREVLMCLELVRGERSRLRAAADLIRQSIREGDLDRRPRELLFYGYLVGEFLRRAGDLPLSSEWFKNLLGLEVDAAPFKGLVLEQLELLREEAGERVNLLSALGQDGDLFAKYREVFR